MGEFVYQKRNKKYMHIYIEKTITGFGVRFVPFVLQNLLKIHVYIHDFRVAIVYSAYFNLMS